MKKIKNEYKEIKKQKNNKIVSIILVKIKLLVIIFSSSQNLSFPCKRGLNVGK